MIHNTSLTTPTIGRISIGEIFENERGQRLPKRLNHFRITTQFKREGQWVDHPLQEAVAKLQGDENRRLTEIPVKLMFNTPELNVSSRLEAYDDKGRMVCAGDGKTAKRVSDGKMESVTCVGCDHCAFGAENGCDKMVRLILQIDATADGFKTDGLSGFILRSRGHNTYKSLTTKIERLAALFKKNIIGVPMTLRLIGKSSRMSKNTPFFYVALDLTNDLITSAIAAKDYAQMLVSAGLDQAAYETTALAQLSSGPFQDTLDDAEELEEFIIHIPEEGESLDLEPLAIAGPAAPEVGLNALRELIGNQANHPKELAAA